MLIMRRENSVDQRRLARCRMAEPIGEKYLSPPTRRIIIWPRPKCLKLALEITG